MAFCPTCGGETFRVEDAAPEPLLTCAGCGRALSAASGDRLAALETDVRALREELARLRQAVTFLNQRVR